MSREAIAAALARTDLSSGERLVAFSLASFADRENLARPGTPAAAGRAGLERSGFLEARDRLVRRGLVVVEVAASGRGKASTLALPFAAGGPVVGRATSMRSCSRRCSATAGLRGPRGCWSRRWRRSPTSAASSTGSRPRTCARRRGSRTGRIGGCSGPLLASGELVLHSSAGGRGNTNRWEVPDPRCRRRRAAPGRGGGVWRRPPSARPLVATVARPVDEQLPIALPGSSPTANGPTGRRRRKGRSGPDGFTGERSGSVRGFG